MSQQRSPSKFQQNMIRRKRLQEQQTSPLHKRYTQSFLSRRKFQQDMTIRMRLSQQS